MQRDRFGIYAGVLIFLTVVLGACNNAGSSTIAPTVVPPTPTVAPAVTRSTPTPTPTAAPFTSGARNLMPTAAVMTRADVPTKAYDTLHYIQTHNGDPPPGYVGGTIFDNREHRLPEGPYKEYDVDPKVPGMSRNAERLVINQDTGQAYYTADHYLTFVLVSPTR